MSTAVSPKILELGALRRICSGCSLRELCLPAGLDNDAIVALDEFVQKRQDIQPQEMAYRAGDPASNVYAVRLGSFKSYRMRKNGDTQIIGVHLPGELFGLDALASEQRQVYTEALEKSNICALPVGDLERLSHQIPAIGRQMMRLMARELNNSYEEHELLANDSALTRVAKFIWRYAQRRQQVGLQYRQFDIAISRQDLANYLGLQVETVSRAFRELRDRKVITASRSKLEILDPIALQALIRKE
ncbi:MAG: helix-turn-helix domain-containing protein [Gammaproteobacteria bacterium]|jgi:CRP/FNR family transcriptional regulator|nr:helix-turn-helix domain-containing protein [Gammaproteobacteria bacterium]